MTSERGTSCLLLIHIGSKPYRLWASARFPAEIAPYSVVPLGLVQDSGLDCEYHQSPLLDSSSIREGGGRSIDRRLLVATRPIDDNTDSGFSARSRCLSVDFVPNHCSYFKDSGTQRHRHLLSSNRRPVQEYDHTSKQALRISEPKSRCHSRQNSHFNHHLRLSATEYRRGQLFFECTLGSTRHVAVVPGETFAP